MKDDNLNTQVITLFKELQKKKITPDIASRQLLELINAFEVRKDIRDLENIEQYLKLPDKLYMKVLVNKNKFLIQRHCLLNKIMLLQKLGEDFSEADIEKMLQVDNLN